MLKKLIKLPKEILIPSVGIILSFYVLVARAVWIDVVTPATIISAADWNQMAVVLADLDDQASRIENFLPGTLCGSYIAGSVSGVRLCMGYNPGDASRPCPPNFTRVGGYFGTGGRNAWVCVKN